MPLSSIAGRLLLALALAVGLVAAVPGSASAVTCSGSGCNGRDPQEYGCSSGAQTHITLTASGYYQQTKTDTQVASLRWTNSCGRVAWLRVNHQATSGPNPDFFVQSCTSGCTSNWHLSGVSHCTDDNGDGVCSAGLDDPWWGDMVGFASNRAIRICGRDVHYNGSYSYGPWTCTPWWAG